MVCPKWRQGPKPCHDMSLLTIFSAWAMLRILANSCVWMDVSGQGL